MKLILCLLLFLTLSLPTRASYLLVVYFHTYENSLHSFANTSSSPIEARCCDGQGNQNCTETCNTILNYCFKESGTVNNFTNDDTILADCVGDTRSSTELMEAMDKIDFSDPPLTINGIATWKSIANRGDIWLGGIQFFVRSTAENNIVDYLFTDISLSPGQNISNQTLHGKHFGENVTFTVGFNLTCIFNFYGDNCSIFCSPSNNSEDGHYMCDGAGNKVCISGFEGGDCNKCVPDFYGEYCSVFCSPEYSDKEGHYTCDSVGNKVCVEGYKSGGNGDCNECIPADGCHLGSCDVPGECNCLPDYGGPLCRQDLDVCGHLDPCRNEGDCNSTGPDSYQCSCKTGYHGVNCTDTSIPAYVLVIAGGVGGLLAPVVILFPLILILCFTALGTWKKSQAKNNGYVDNPMYGQTPVPPSVCNTLRSETEFSNTRQSEADHSLMAMSVSVRDTPSPCKEPLDDPDYDIIPAEEGVYDVPPPPVPLYGQTLALSSVSSTLRSDVDHSSILKSHSSTLKSEVHHSNTLRSELDRSSSFNSEANRSTTLGSELARSNTFKSEIDRSSSFRSEATHISTLRSEFDYSNTLRDYSSTLRSEGDYSGTLGSETNHSFISMSIGTVRETPSLRNKPRDDPEYDIPTEEGAYDILSSPPVPPRNSKLSTLYDVPKRHDFSL